MKTLGDVDYSVQRSVRHSVGGPVMESVEDSVRGSVQNSVWKSVYNSVWNNGISLARYTMFEATEDFVYDSKRIILEPETILDKSIVNS